MEEDHDVAVLDYVFFAFDADETLIAGSRVGAKLEKRIPWDNFSANEFGQEVVVNDRARNGRVEAAKSNAR